MSGMFEKKCFFLRVSGMLEKIMFLRRKLKYSLTPIRLSYVVFILTCLSIKKYYLNQYIASILHCLHRLCFKGFARQPITSFISLRKSEPFHGGKFKQHWHNQKLIKLLFILNGRITY